jgi:hypothetical protein
MPVQIRPEELIKLLRGEFLALTASQYQTGDQTVAFTPLGGGTVTIDPAICTLAYTRIERMVTVTGFLNISAVAGPSGVLRISGLPFVCATGNQFFSAVSVTARDLAAGAVTSVVGYVISGTTNIDLYAYAAGVAGVLADYCQANSYFVLSATYFTN